MLIENPQPKSKYYNIEAALLDQIPELDNDIYIRKNYTHTDLFKTMAFLPRKEGSIKLTSVEGGDDFNIILLERNRLKLPYLSQKSIDNSELWNVESSLCSDYSVHYREINDFKSKFITTITEPQQQKQLVLPFTVSSIKHCESDQDIVRMQTLPADNILKANDECEEEDNDKRGERSLNMNEFKEIKEKEKDTIACIVNKIDSQMPFKKIQEEDHQLDKSSIFDNNLIRSNTDNKHNEEDRLIPNSILNQQSNALVSMEEYSLKQSLLEPNRNSNQIMTEIPLNINNIIKPNFIEPLNIKINSSIDNKEEGKEYQKEYTFPSTEQRRYKPKTLIANKDFFKMRYLNQNLRSAQLATTMKNKDSPNTRGNNHKNLVFYFDDSKVMKYSSFYSNDINTAIFQLKSKKYEQALNSLCKQNIIKNNEEFAEILLLEEGFDKGIIGEFLSNDKYPNDNFKITQFYMSKLDLRNEDFLLSFRMLLSLIKLPSQNTENIIKYFSKSYYADNLGSLYSTNYEDISQLCFFALEVNKIFRSPHKAITFKEIIRQYPNINPELGSKIINSIQLKRLPSLTDNYYDDIKASGFSGIFQETITSNKANTVLNTVNSITSNPLANSNKTNNRPAAAESSNNNNFKKYSIADLMPILKRGETFRRKNRKGTIRHKIFILAEDEQSFLIKNTQCGCSFLSNKRISIDSITKVFLGNESKEQFDNHFTIHTKTKRYELYNSNTKTILKWYNGFSFLLKKKNSFNDLKDHQNFNNQNKNEALSILWSEIFKNWADYREFFQLKIIKTWFVAKKSSCNKSVLDFTNKNLKINKEQVLTLWTLGLPECIRDCLWKIMIGNQLEICENLLDNYIHISQDEIELMPNSELLKIINRHINKMYHKFEAYISQTEETFKDDLYIIIRTFCLYRPDIIYSKQITYFASIFYLHSNGFYEAFVLLCNFTIPNCFFQLLLRDKDFDKNFSSFYEFLLIKKVPVLYDHITNLGLHIHTIFLKWAQYLFITAFDYEIMLRIWDNFILKGNITIFEVALAIMIVQEKEFITESRLTILSCLKHFPKKYTESDLFQVIDTLHIEQEFTKHFDTFELGKENDKIFLAFS